MGTIDDGEQIEAVSDGVEQIKKKPKTYQTESAFPLSAIIIKIPGVGAITNSSVN